MKRALLLVLDSVGIGHAPDAAAFGDEGANTVGHIREKIPGIRIPHLDRCGLRHAEALAAEPEVGGRTSEVGGRTSTPTLQHSNTPTLQFSNTPTPALAWGSLTEKSPGKDTTTGHWEIAGARLEEPFATFESFPPKLVTELEEAAGVRFIGNYARSGTVILEELGAEHVATGHPILYTSSDSVLQIAAHEEIVPLSRLYEICRACRVIADRERIGRVIARPFIGEAGNFRRTANRHDFSLEPPRTVLDCLGEGGVHTVGIGKISDIFAGKGIAESFPTKSNEAGMAMIGQLWQEPAARPVLYFANLVDFDMLYGHRRDVEGYARCLEAFDRWLGTFLPLIDDGESLFMITADHGNDPSWTGTDHTREKVPLLALGPNLGSCLGDRKGFGDIAATLAHYFGVSYLLEGRSFL